MTFKIKKQDGSTDSTVRFEFDINKDTPNGVANEMVEQIPLPRN